MLLLIELSFLDELAKALPATLEAVLLLVKKSMPDELVNATAAFTAAARRT